MNLREYEGTGAALALLDQSRPGDWDVLVIDGIDVFRAVDAGILAPLPAAQLPIADFFPEVVMEENNTVDGVTYAVTEKFGYNTISYNAAQRRSGRHGKPDDRLVGKIRRPDLDL